jgi:hypothetical protein
MLLEGYERLEEKIRRYKNGNKGVERGNKRREEGYCAMNIFPEPSDYAYIRHKHILLSILIEQQINH